MHSKKIIKKLMRTIKELFKSLGLNLTNLTKPMESIRELIQSKPSIALQAMVDGLREQSKRKNFKVDMRTFGEGKYLNNPVMCYGCAATCTLQKIAGKNLTVDNINVNLDRAQFLKFELTELRRFEFAICDASIGLLYGLFYFCRIDTAALNKISYDGFRLSNNNCNG